MKGVFLCLCTCLFFAAAGAAQDSRGSITGRVTDQQRAVIPGAFVVVTNTETNLAVRTSSNQSGYFEATLLNPGRYSVAVEASGFRRAVRSGLDLNVAGRVNVEVELQVGQVAETVKVTADAPLLETSSASSGRVIDNRQIMELPFSDMKPFALSALAPGMQWTEERRRAEAPTPAENSAWVVAFFC